MASLSPSPALSCSVRQMFTYSSASFRGNSMCNWCSLFTVMEAWLSDLEAWFHTMEVNPLAAVVSQPTITGSEHLSVTPSSRPSAVPEQNI